MEDGLCFFGAGSIMNLYLQLTGAVSVPSLKNGGFEMVRTSNWQIIIRRIFALILAFGIMLTMITPTKAAEPANVSTAVTQLDSLISKAKTVDLQDYQDEYADLVEYAINKAEKVAANSFATKQLLNLARLELQIALDTLVVDLQKATTVDLHSLVKSGNLTYKELTRMYLDRIELYDFNTIKLNSVRVLNSNALADAEKCDEIFAENPSVAAGMFGMPTLIKDNINVMGMPTTAGNVALADNYAPYDAPLITYLKESGAVILGKTNLAEFANYFSSGMPNGWSSVGKQVNNVNRPQLLFSSATGTARESFSNPSGSSSGSAVAGAAALSAVTIGTETNGSILSPSSTQSLVGIKPTRGLISRYGVVPLAETQDTAGPMVRNVTDAAVLLTALAGYDSNDETTKGIAEAGVTGVDYTESLRLNGLAGKRIGLQGSIPSRESNPAYHAALDALEAAGALIVNRPTSANGSGTGYTYTGSAPAESTVFYYDMAKNMPIYLATLGDDYPIKTLQDIIDFTYSYAEIHGYAETFSSNVSASNRMSHLRNANNVDLEKDFENYQSIRQQRWNYSRGNLDRILTENNLDAIITNASTISIGAMAGYPTINIPLSQRDRNNGASLSFTGAPFTEAKLIEFAYVVEQAQETFKRTPPGLADRMSGLDQAIGVARGFTVEERAPFQTIYDSVFAVYRNNYAAQMDIDKANDELRTAILVVQPVDKAALTEAIASAKKINALYLLGSAGENFRSLLESAALVNADELSLQSEVNSVQTALNDILNNPAYLLQSMVDFSNMIKGDIDYLSGDKTAFFIALDKAQNLLADPAATTGDLLEALETLNSALVVLNPETNILKVGIETDAHLVKKGDYFRVTSFFEKEVSTNAVVLKYTFDDSKFTYRDFVPSDGTTLLNTVVGDGVATFTLMISDYKAKNLGEVIFSADEDANLGNEHNSINLNLRCVVLEDAVKQVYIAHAGVTFTSAEDREFVLIDLSNLIDWFDFDTTHPDWNTVYIYWDFNNNGVIDIYDIVFVARLIK